MTNKKFEILSNMKSISRSQGQIIADLKNLVKEQGFIYVICNIILHDLIVNPESLHKIDYFEKININEATLLLGLWIQQEINTNLPENEDIFLSFKHKTYELLNELHFSFNSSFLKHLENKISDKDSLSNGDANSIWKEEEMIIEPIFYGGTEIYDFQYLNHLTQKYKYDKEWIFENYHLDFENVKQLITDIKSLIQTRIHNSSDLFSPKYFINDAKEYLKEEKRKKESHNNSVDNYCQLEIDTYKAFFEVHGFEKYCFDLLNLFCFDKSDFVNTNDHFFNLFSLSINEYISYNINKVGDYNIINSHPIIKLNSDKYFLPIPFLLFQAVYESPYYWIIRDREYKDIASNHRGKVGEELFYNILVEIFSKDNTFKSVKIKSSKSKSITDIDVLCILGNKALIVQIKSKKLTLLSKQGSISQLEKDFKEAIQEAYDQGLKCRKSILEHNNTFYDEYDNEIILNEAIDECYIVCGTTEIFNAISFQLKHFLVKDINSPYPLSFSIFDLELIAHYLKDPYDFLFYIKQRIVLMEYYHVASEIDILAYHLTQNLYKIPRYDLCSIDSTHAQLIDRNYYPLKEGIKVSDEGDRLKFKWYNKDFDKLLVELKSCKIPKFTDLIFHLLEQSSDAREMLIDHLIKTKDKTLKDLKNHNFTFPPDDKSDNRDGITYVSLASNDMELLKKELFNRCESRKYLTKADIWMGFGSIIDSTRIIDYVLFNDRKWEYDEELESRFKNYSYNSGQYIMLNKIGRNKPCYCGSGFKYKNCCGK